MTSCAVIEEYTSKIFKKESKAVAEESVAVSDTETIDENDAYLYDESPEVYDDSFVYEEDIYNDNDDVFNEENIVENEVGDVANDSIEMALQERIDKENSGEAIVEESDIMMGMIENLADIPYFEQHKLESSSKSKNIYNYPENFKTLHTRKGVCYDFSNLFAALCRSQNVPCYVVDGISYETSAQHTWNRVYYNGTWWDADVTNDITANQNKEKSYGFCEPESSCSPDVEYEIIKIY